MKNKGFTLVEVLIGLCLLGLISVVVLPIINSSFKLSNKYFPKAEMMYLGEMSIEKIKAFKDKDDSSIYILDTKLEDIISSFKINDSIEIILNSSSEYKDYEIKLKKSQKCNKLWKLHVLVYPINEEDKNNYVQYKALLPSK